MRLGHAGDLDKSSRTRNRSAGAIYAPFVGRLSLSGHQLSRRIHPFPYRASGVDIGSLAWFVSVLSRAVRLRRISNHLTYEQIELGRGSPSCPPTYGSQLSPVAANLAALHLYALRIPHHDVGETPAANALRQVHPGSRSRQGAPRVLKLHRTSAPRQPPRSFFADSTTAGDRPGAMQYLACRCEGQINAEFAAQQHSAAGLSTNSFRFITRLCHRHQEKAKQSRYSSNSTASSAPILPQTSLRQVGVC